MRRQPIGFCRSGLTSPTQRCAGWSLVEMSIVLAVGLVVAAFAKLALQPTLMNTQMDQAYNLTMGIMRQSRQRAIDERKIYVVSFASPNVIKLLRQDGGSPRPAPVQVNSWFLLSNIQFLNVAGIPNTAATSPDGFGTGGRAIDFSINVGGGGGTAIYFQPDGSARDSIGSVNNGILYLARANDLYSSRAITLFGLSGRVRGWRLARNNASGLPVWQQQ